jgi:hypothetical protein
VISLKYEGRLWSSRNDFLWGGGDTFEVLPLSNYALSPKMLPLIKTFVKLLMWNSFKSHRQTFLDKVEVKLSLCLTKHHTMKTYWENGGIVPRILWPRRRWRWSTSRPGRFTPIERAWAGSFSEPNKQKPNPRIVQNKRKYNYILNQTKTYTCLRTVPISNPCHRPSILSS